MNRFKGILGWVNESRASIWKAEGKTAVFFSGGHEGFFPVLNDRGNLPKVRNDWRAEKQASTTDGLTLRQTIGWKQFHETLKDARERGQLSREERKTLIREVAKRFSREAEGHIHAFTLGLRRDAARSMFLVAELPELLRNKNVQTINGYSREKLAELHRDVERVTEDKVQALVVVNEELNTRRELDLARNKTFVELLKRREEQIQMEKQKEFERQQREALVQKPRLHRRDGPELNHEI